MNCSVSCRPPWRSKSSPIPTKPTNHSTGHAQRRSRRAEVAARFLERQPRPHRHEMMVATLARPAMEMVAGNLLRVWLLKKHKQMLIDFLDAPRHCSRGRRRRGVAAHDGRRQGPRRGGWFARETPARGCGGLSARLQQDERGGVAKPKTMLDSDPRLQLGAAA